MYAAYNGDLPMLEILLSCRYLSLHAKSADGQTARAIALNNKQGVSALMLAEADLIFSLEPYDPAGLLAMIRQGAFVDTSNADGWTPLLVACRMGDVATVRELVFLGADVNRVEADGWNCLMFASFYGFESMVEDLLAAGANPLVRTHTGQTARLIAKTRNHTNILERLERELESIATPSMRMATQLLPRAGNRRFDKEAWLRTVLGSSQ